MLNKKELLKSPERKWDDTEKEYDAILFVPAGTKHDSGFMHIAVIGVTYDRVNNKESYEIVAYPDDISTLFEPISIPGANFKIANVRMDCYYPSGVFRYYGGGKFKVSTALSSIDIAFIPIRK